MIFPGTIATSSPKVARERSEAIPVRATSFRDADREPPLSSKRASQTSSQRFPSTDQIQRSWPCNVLCNLLVNLFLSLGEQDFKQVRILLMHIRQMHAN